MVMVHPSQQSTVTVTPVLSSLALDHAVHPGSTHQACSVAAGCAACQLCVNIRPCQRSFWYNGLAELFDTYFCPMAFPNRLLLKSECKRLHAHVRTLAPYFMQIFSKTLDSKFKKNWCPVAGGVEWGGRRGRVGPWSIRGGGEGDIQTGASGNQAAEGSVAWPTAGFLEGDEHPARMQRQPLHHPLCRRQPAAGKNLPFMYLWELVWSSRNVVNFHLHEIGLVPMLLKMNPTVVWILGKSAYWTLLGQSFDGAWLCPVVIVGQHDPGDGLHGQWEPVGCAAARWPQRAPHLPVEKPRQKSGARNRPWPAFPAWAQVR